MRLKQDGFSRNTNAKAMGREKVLMSVEVFIRCTIFVTHTTTLRDRTIRLSQLRAEDTDPRETQCICEARVLGGRGCLIRNRFCSQEGTWWLRR